MEGLNTDKEKDKKAEMSFSSRRLKKTQTATRQEYGIALSPLDYYLWYRPGAFFSWFFLKDQAFIKMWNHNSKYKIYTYCI